MLVHGCCRHATCSRIFIKGSKQIHFSPRTFYLTCFFLYSLHVKNSSLWKLFKDLKNYLPGECAEIVQIRLQFGLHSFPHCHFWHWDPLMRYFTAHAHTRTRHVKTFPPFRPIKLQNSFAVNPSTQSHRLITNANPRNRRRQQDSLFFTAMPRGAKESLFLSWIVSWKVLWTVWRKV